jgi:hypothetical protein
MTLINNDLIGFLNAEKITIISFLSPYKYSLAYIAVLCEYCKNKNYAMP